MEHKQGLTTRGDRIVKAFGIKTTYNVTKHTKKTCTKRNLPHETNTKSSAEASNLYSEINSNLQKPAFHYEHTVEENLVAEWISVAYVFDRLFLVIFLLGNIVGGVMVFYQHMYTDTRRDDSHKYAHMHNDSEATLTNIGKWIARMC